MADRGRPREREQAKNAPLNMRTSPELRAQIEAAAEVNGRSLTLEVERRLYTSFIFDEARGGPHIGALANMICACVQAIELDTGARWMDDFDTFTEVRAAIDRIVEWRNPGLPGYDAIAEVEDKAASATAARVSAERTLSEFRAQKDGTPLGLGSAPGAGMFGGRRHSPSRAEWSPQDRDQDAQLEQDAIAARETEQSARADRDATIGPALQRMKAHERAGRTIADAAFAKYGPRN